MEPSRHRLHLCTGVILYTHNHITYTSTYACMQNHNDDTIKTSDTVLRKIYLSYSERVVCERELETEQNCNILTPTLLAITAFLSRSPGLLNCGPSLSRCWFSLPHLISNSSAPQLVWFTTLYRGPKGSLSWVLAFSSASCLQLIGLPVDCVI